MFFTYMDQVLTPGVDLNLTISKSADGLTVMVMPKLNGLEDPAKNRLVPLVMTASPAEMDKNFFPAMAAPVQNTSAMLVNMKEYEDAAKEVEKSSKAAKDAKDKESKEAKDKKDKFDASIKKAEEFETAGKLQEALKEYETAKSNATEKTTKSVDEKIAVVKSKLSQGNLFDVPAQQPAQAAVVQQPVQAPVQQPQAPIVAPQSQIQTQQQSSQPVGNSTQAGGIQPNMAFGMFGPPAVQAQPVQQTPSHHIGNPGIPSFQNGPIYNPADYAGIEDFPMEMIAPPVFAAQAAAGA